MAEVGNNDIFPDKWWLWALGTLILYFGFKFLFSLC